MRRVLFWFWLTTAVWAVPTQLMPVDEAAKDPTFAQFRTRLKDIVQRKDVAALKAVLDPKINYSFGASPPGPAGFSKYWALDRSGSQLWQELGLVLERGGGFDKGGSFVAPYASSHWPDSLGPYDYCAVAGRDVRARAGPGTEYAVMMELSYDLLKVLERKPGWFKVQLPDGRAGWISETLVISPVGYRAYFSRQSGQWKMTTFIAGD